MKQLLGKCFDFSIRAIELIRYLNEENKPFPLCERFLTCATGIGISLRCGLMTDEGSARTITEALTATIEAEYLLELMVKTGYLQEKQSQPIINDCRALKDAIAKHHQITQELQLKSESEGKV